MSAVLLAGDDRWNGRGWERRGRNLFLFRSSDKRYFIYNIYICNILHVILIGILICIFISRYFRHNKKYIDDIYYYFLSNEEFSLFS